MASSLITVKRELQRQLIDWFRVHARDLPWRKTRDAYRVWISEVMLQQTQVATVIPYYERFLQAFPTVSELAAAPEELVLRLWEGLGYYRRARQLQAAARCIVSEHGGQFPSDAEAVRRLPGIGRYTAGAILSIAFDRPEPILEANTVRLFSRLSLERGPITAPVTRNRLWAVATELVPERDARLFNQAAMELGSLICTPRSPRCSDCPIAQYCPTYRAGLQQQIPAAAPKMVRTEVVEAAVVIRAGDRVLIRRCGPGERWAGLWDFPRFPVETVEPLQFSKEIATKTKALVGLAVKPLEQLTTLRHAVTRFNITLHCLSAQPVAKTKACSLPQSDDLRWVLPSELASFPLSVTGRKISNLLRD